MEPIRDWLHNGGNLIVYGVGNNWEELHKLEQLAGLAVEKHDAETSEKIDPAAQVGICRWKCCESCPCKTQAPAMCRWSTAPLNRWHKMHGNRILFLDEAAEDAFQAVGREAGAVAFAAETIFQGSVRRQDGHCQASQHGRRLRSVPPANAAGVFGKSYIQHPVQLVLDPQCWRISWPAASPAAAGSTDNSSPGLTHGRRRA